MTNAAATYMKTSAKERSSDWLLRILSTAASAWLFCEHGIRQVSVGRKAPVKELEA